MGVNALNNVRVVTTTTGQGTITLGAAYSDNFLTEVDAGAVDGTTYRFRVDEGNDFQLVSGVYTASGRTITLATVHKSKIGGVVGTTKMTLAGSATVRFVESAEDFNKMVRADGAQSFTPTETLQARNNIDVSIKGHLFGLTLSTAGSSSTFSVAAGAATDNTNDALITLAASISKTTGAWAVGTGNGGLDTSTIANSTWYHAHLIKRVDTGVNDVLVSLSATAPTLPTNYTLSRRIGSMLTDGSGHWVKFIQTGDNFAWDAAVLDATAPDPGTSAVLAPLSVPAGISVIANMNVRSTGGTSTRTLFSDPAITDAAPSTTLAPLHDLVSNASADGAMQISVRTDTSRQVRYRMTAPGTGVTLYIVTIGWVDRRGRDS